MTFEQAFRRQGRPFDWAVFSDRFSRILRTGRIEPARRRKDRGKNRPVALYKKNENARNDGFHSHSLLYDARFFHQLSERRFRFLERDVLEVIADLYSHAVTVPERGKIAGADGPGPPFGLVPVVSLSVSSLNDDPDLDGGFICFSYARKAFSAGHAALGGDHALKAPCSDSSAVLEHPVETSFPFEGI